MIYYIVGDIMSTKALDHKCPACRAVIKWNPSIEKFKGEYCDSEY